MSRGRPRRQLAGTGERPRFNEERKLWEARYSAGYLPDGRRIQRWVRAKTADACQTKLTDALALVRGGLTPNKLVTVKDFLHWWLDNIDGVATATHANYRNVAELYVIPHLGRKRLTELRPADVTKMLRVMAEPRPVKDGKPKDGLSPNTQRLARSILRRALRRAEQEGLVSRNVAAIADGPKVGSPTGRTLTPKQASTLLASLDEHRLAAAFTVMLATGLRRGELLGLRWSALDLKSNPATLTVHRALKRLPDGLALEEPKTKTSRRTVHLAPFAAAALRRHRKMQAAEQMLAGEEWVARPLGADLVFRTPFGTAVDPDNFRNICYRVTEAALGDRFSPHELRHSAASLLLAQGVSLKIISEVLGHSSIRITSDVYAHLMAPALTEASDAMQRALGGRK